MERGKQVFATPGFDIGRIIRGRTGFELAGIVINKERAEIHWVDPEIKELQNEVTTLIKGGNARIVSLSHDVRTALVRIGAPNSPGAYFLYRKGEEGIDQIAVNNSVIGMKLMHPVRTIRYKARDGLEIAAVLTLPRGREKNLPLIVMPHGGPRARDTEEWDWWAQFLADRGYAVIQPNFRGSTGYGTVFMEKGEGQWGLAMQDDLNDAVGALSKLGIADPKRVCMVGASYGGYAAMRAAQRDGALYRCAASYAGVSDLGWAIRQDRAYVGATTRKRWLQKQVPDLKSVSPLNFVHQVSIPVLLIHGKKDRVVNVDQSRSMAQRLRAAGKDVRYVEQPEGDHHFTRSEDRLQFLQELETFLAKHNPA